MLLASVPIWGFAGAQALAETTTLPQKFFECASVVVFWFALIILVATNKNAERKESNK